MIEVTCPDELRTQPLHHTSIFMAGGITGCPDWQTAVLDRFRNTSNLILINPRRQDWSQELPGADQIEWEYRHLHLADEVYFWFPKEGKCMITLFELGSALGKGRKVRIGVEPGYIREFDVVEQVKRAAPWLTVYEKLSDVYAPLL